MSTVECRVDHPARNRAGSVACRRRALLIAFTAAAFAQPPALAQPRALESVIPALDYGPGCTSSIEAVNLTSRPVTAEIVGHKAGGALVLLAGQSETTVHLEPGGRASFRLRVENEEGAGWVLVREPKGAPSLALSAAVECVDGNRLVSAARQVVYPLYRPWFAGEIADLAGGVVTAINVSTRSARLSACYSAGNLVSIGRPELVPLCSATLEVEIPPFGTRRIPVERGGNSWFSVRTAGESVVLEMLRPIAPRVKLYRVDSTIQFGQEVIPAK